GRSWSACPAAVTRTWSRRLAFSRGRVPTTKEWVDEPHRGPVCALAGARREGVDPVYHRRRSRSGHHGGAGGGAGGGGRRHRGAGGPVLGPAGGWSRDPAGLAAGPEVGDKPRPDLPDGALDPAAK